MKKIFFTLFSALLFLTYNGCSNDGGGGTTDPFGGGGGGGGTGNVTFQVQTDGTSFGFTASTTVTVTTITANSAGANVTNDVWGNANQETDPRTTFSIGPYNNIASGQSWSFAIAGHIGNAQGQAYNVTANFTVP